MEQIEILDKKEVFKQLLENYIDILNNKPCCYFNIGYGYKPSYMIFEDCSTNNRGLEQIQTKIIDKIKLNFDNKYIDIYNEVLAYSIKDNSQITKFFNLAFIEKHYFIPFYDKMLGIGIISKDDYKKQLNSSITLLVNAHKRRVNWFKTELKELILNNVKQNSNNTTPPQKKIKPLITPKILNEDLDILFDRLKAKELQNCKKTEYNKLFNGTDTNTIKIEWHGTIGLLKNIFKELNTLYNFEYPLYYQKCFQYTIKQYKNNKISKRDENRTKELLKKK